MTRISLSCEQQLRRALRVVVPVVAHVHARCVRTGIFVARASSRHRNRGAQSIGWLMPRRAVAMRCEAGRGERDPAAGATTNVNHGPRVNPPWTLSEDLARATAGGALAHWPTAGHHSALSDFAIALHTPPSRLMDCSHEATITLCWRFGSQPSSPRGSMTWGTCEGALGCLPA